MTVKPTIGNPAKAGVPNRTVAYRHLVRNGEVSRYVWMTESPNVGPNRATRRSWK